MVSYYDVEGEIEIINNNRFLIAREGTPKYILLFHHFVQLGEKRWARYISPEQYQYLMKEGEGVFLAGKPVYEDPNTREKAKRLAGIGMILLGVSFTMPFVFPWLFNVLFQKPCTDISVFIMLFLWVVTFAIMLKLRTEHVNNTAGKILMGFFIIVGIITAVSAALTIAVIVSLQQR